MYNNKKRKLVSSKPGLFKKCRENEVEGFNNEGEARCFTSGMNWMKRYSIFPEGQQDTFEFLKDSFRVEKIEDLYFLHRFIIKLHSTHTLGGWDLNACVTSKGPIPPLVSIG